MKGKLIYEEKDGFRGTWAWYLTIAVSLYILFTFGRGIYLQVLNGETWGAKPLSNTQLWLTTLFTFLFIVVIFLFIDMHRLHIQLDSGTIRYKFAPYFRTFRTLHKAQIREAYVRRYKPIREYGGWGYRLGFGKGRAYNIRGNWGLQLVLEDGKKLLLGTQKPIELNRALQKIDPNWGEK